MSAEIDIDKALKAAQILFYLTASIVTVLTYRSAKNGLLNTVNTEYQKKVINKLEEISTELGSEFDPTSPNYWATSNPVRQGVSHINKAFERNRDYILEIGEYPFGVIVPSNIDRLNNFISRIKSDPFIPQEIRESIINVLARRKKVAMGIYFDELETYSQSLLDGREPFKTNGEDPEFDDFHNSIIEKLNEKGYGITKIEAEVDKVRLHIQEYLESFNPVKRKIPKAFK